MAAAKKLIWLAGLGRQQDVIREALLQNNIACLRFAIKLGATMEHIRESYCYPLKAASCTGSIKMLKMLDALGAREQDYNQACGLYMAVYYGRVDTLRHFKATWPNAGPGFYRKVLLMTCRINDVPKGTRLKVLSGLVEMGITAADCCAHDGDIVKYAAERSDVEILCWLVETMRLDVRYIEKCCEKEFRRALEWGRGHFLQWAFDAGVLTAERLRGYLEGEPRLPDATVDWLKRMGQIA